MFPNRRADAAFSVVMAFLAIAGVGVVGCSDGRLELAPVSGVVTVAGKPLRTGRIIFQPHAGRSAFGRIEAGQICDVTTYDAGDGVPVGSQKVAIVPDVDEEVGMSDPLAYARAMRQGAVPLRFHQPGTSGLVADIKPGQTNGLQFDLPQE